MYKENTFIIPVVDEEITDVCIESLASIGMDLYAEIVIIDNSETGFADKYKEYLSEVIIVRNEENKGVAASWNQGIRLSNTEYVWIVSASMKFGAGFLLIDLPRATYMRNKFGLLTEHAWRLICLGRDMIENVGMFDENFFPAYMEDNDYLYRMKLLGIHDDGITAMPKIPVDAECQMEAHGRDKAGIEIDTYPLELYYRKKWGGNPGAETYTKPFNGDKDAARTYSTHGQDWSRQPD